MNVVDPEVRYWEGRVACSICHHGKWGNETPLVRSVVPIDVGLDHPIVPLECPACGNMTLEPYDEDAE
jgi:hypothetical protein